ncbi:regulator of chromosome condensation 1/beta-lactamase-inhibitor protein II, partial [Jimgerdemannia flammicorona]
MSPNSGRYRTTYEDYQDEASPRELTSLRGRGVVDIVPDGYSFHVLDRNGLVWMWGHQTRLRDGNIGFWLILCRQMTETGTVYNLPTRVHLPISVSSISCGRTHAMALSQSGRAFQWRRVEAPVEIIISSNSPIMHIAAGWGFGALLTASGEIFCFTEKVPKGAKAQRRHVRENVTLASVLVSSTSLFAEAEVLGTMFTSVACGEHFMVALTDAGAVLRFRMMFEDLLVDTSSVEHLTKFTFDAGMQDTDKTITRIMAFFRHFAAVNHEGAVLLGKHNSSSPIVFSELRKGICQVSFGDWHYGAITADGRLLTWGSVSSGALGHPMKMTRPTVVGGALVGKYVFAIGFGGWHSGALAVDLSDEAGARPASR